VIIDMHTHVWPDAIARRALSSNIPTMPLRGDGTVAGLRRAQQEAGVDRSVCLAVATSAQQVEAANRFVGSLDREHVIPFGTIHPDLSIEENRAHLERAGVPGVKLHPAFQRFRLDDPRLRALLDALSPDYVFIAHVGATATDDGAGATPRMLRQLSDDLPALRIVACHFGGYHRLTDAEEQLVGSRVHLDTSWPPSLGELDPTHVRELVRRHGADRVVFASDWPTASVAAELTALRSLGLDDDEVRMISGENAAELLRLD
jgi:hypothetical protein